ncbi:unnamed protein product [Rhizoctonia solani]|uniref:Uncharacterized protein n=1 Tax=Rhizoctonia solani TaxID=456999 RepID=A0A8H3D894_9AGAM|nr:unnamed protein product [Rhizoctonia solani]
MLETLNTKVAESAVGRWFRLDGCGHPKQREGSLFTTELRAGTTTFFAMAYIIAVNASILADSGGTCVCESTADDPICVQNEAYSLCKEVVRRDLITTSAAVAALASVLMGFFANLPVALAPGLGLNAYFAYSVVGFNGSGSVTYQEALAAVFLEGWLFFILSIFGIRQWLARIIPRSLTLATGAGIGLFIALIGLGSAGLGVVGGDYTNLVGLGGCTSEYRDPDHANYCLSHVLRSPTMWLGIFVGGIFTTLLLLYRVRGAIIMGGKGQVWIALITFLYVDLFDTTGTLYSMAKFSGVMNPRTRDFEGSTVAYMVDAFCISMGSLMGTSPVTAFIESATGISDGGKTGITAIVTGICFFIAVFFSPIFASIPGYATGGALVLVGSLMIKNVVDINWHYIGDAVPAFLTLIIIPFTYNIAYGLITGIITYVLLNTLPWAIRRLTGRRISPPGYEDEREPWGLPEDGLLPLWMRKLARGDRRFWTDDESYADDHSVRSRKTIDGVDSTGKTSEEAEKGRV